MFCVTLHIIPKTHHGSASSKHKTQEKYKIHMTENVQDDSDHVMA
jgi:hypothetical protein